MRTPHRASYPMAQQGGHSGTPIGDQVCAPIDRKWYVMPPLNRDLSSYRRDYFSSDLLIGAAIFANGGSRWQPVQEFAAGG